MARIIPFVLVFFLGVFVTNAVSSDPEPEVRYQQHTVTKTQVKTKTVEVPTLSDSCRRSMGHLERLYPLMQSYDKALGPQESVANDTMAAIQFKDFKQLNAAIERQREINAGALPAKNAMSSLITILEKEFTQCRSDLKE
jgi:hypothetical protein